MLKQNCRELQHVAKRKENAVTPAQELAGGKAERKGSS